MKLDSIELLNVGLGSDILHLIHKEKIDHFCVSQMLGKQNFLIQENFREKNLSWFLLRAEEWVHTSNLHFPTEN